MKKRRIITLVIVSLLIVILLFLFSTSCSASAPDVVVSLTLENTTMQVNGVTTKIDSESDTAPVIVNNRILLPIRAIVEAFGGKVGWDGKTNTVLLKMDGTTINLGIGDDTAYINGEAKALDAVPTVINQRTMLPVRFVAEGFNLGVAWEQDKKRVTIVRNTFDDEEYTRLMEFVPDYCGNAYVVVNDNKPFFKDYEIIGGSFEYYSNLDNLGRCDVCMASVGEDIMPQGERGNISSVTPTGWKNEAYEWVDGKYVYNRCHLIGYQLTGENANKRNLITGTRYMNVDGMLPFENIIDDYIEESGNNVVYRVTPVFSGNNLVADGVLLEAYSVEDNGAGISFCVYCYNVQPGVVINYRTGENRAEKDYTPSDFDTKNDVNQVYRTPSGKKYHYDKECGGNNSFLVTLDLAISAGLTPCGKCAE